MGARFDKWLARPSTLRFLRQLIGPESTVARTKQPRWNAPHRRDVRRYSTAHSALLSHPPGPETCNGSASLPTPASIETLHEQRERVAQELGLRIPRGLYDDASSDRLGSAPSSTRYADLLYSETRVKLVKERSSARGLLIDEPENHGNLEAWRNILEHRKRTDGHRGVVDVWDGMRKRGISLPVDGDLADAFWTIFLHTAIDAATYKRAWLRRLLHEVFEHAKDLKGSGSGQYRSFHKILIGRHLRLLPGVKGNKSRFKMPIPEYEWHQMACEAGLCDPQSLAFLVMDVLKSSKPELAFRRWQTLYHHDRFGVDNPCGMYDLCIPLVILHAPDDPAFIIAWHNFFASNNDMPSPELATNRSIKLLLGNDLAHDTGSDGSKFSLAEFRATVKQDRGDAQPSTSPILSRASMSGYVGDVHGIKPVKISDKFCARMFATQAFSLETSIRGLALLGTEALGPIALRELAVRAATLDTFKDRLADVRSAGIAISSSTYAHILRVVVFNAQDDLFQALLASDQHPESYDDRHTQETLLDSFLQTEDWSSAHLTLIGLSQSDFAETSRAWNRLLQHYIKTENLVETLRIASHMLSEEMTITSRSLNFMKKYILPTRTPGKYQRPSSGLPVGRHATELVVNAHMYAASRGQEVDAVRWIEFLKRFGMTGNIDGVERLTHWLVAQYIRQRTRVNYIRRKQKLYRITGDTFWAEIFNPIMQRAIVIWAFRGEIMHNNEHSPLFQQPSTSNDPPTSTSSWTRGISLLLWLKGRGVDVKTKDVRRAVREILWMLFGPGVSNKALNAVVTRKNRLTILQYVTDANKAWDEPLFDLDINSSDVDYATKEAHVVHAVFGDQRLTDKKAGTWADVASWATAIDEGTWEAPSSSTSDRRDAWSESSFQFNDALATTRQRWRASRKQERQMEATSRSQTHTYPQDDKNQQNSTTDEVRPPPHPQPAAQPSNWRPLPSQPDTQEQP